MPAGIADLERRVGHDFARPELLVEALTHSSAIGAPREKGKRRPTRRRSYERLEFLGDRVLGLVIAETLWARFPEEAEGKLTERLHRVVRQNALVQIAESIDLGRHLILSTGERHAGTAERPTLLADACEALVAAVYLDAGLDRAREIILRLWEPLIGGDGPPERDPKTTLQEWAQARGLALPVYRVVETDGPDHARQFTIAVSVEGQAEAVGTASSKRGAEIAAAATLLQVMSEPTGRFTTAFREPSSKECRS